MRITESYLFRYCLVFKEFFGLWLDTLQVEFIHQMIKIDPLSFNFSLKYRPLLRLARVTEGGMTPTPKNYSLYS